MLDCAGFTVFFDIKKAIKKVESLMRKNETKLDLHAININ